MDDPLKIVKPRRRRRTGVQVELAKTEKRLTQATRGMGESAGEMLKAAALQLVAKKLDEVIGLLRGAGLTKADVLYGKPVFDGINYGTISSADPKRPDPLAALEAMERKTYGGLDANGKPAAGVIPGITCQICGRPAVYKTRRNMTLCIVHKGQGLQDDKDDGVRAQLAKGFGSAAAHEEVIQVDSGVIQGALANGEAGESNVDD